MKLFITDDPMDSLSGVILRPADLGCNLSQCVIASQRWEACYIDITEDIPDGRVRYLGEQCDVIFPAVPSKPSMHQMHILCDIFPKLSGTIRKAFMQKRDMHEVLPNVWDKEA